MPAVPVRADGCAKTPAGSGGASVAAHAQRLEPSAPMPRTGEGASAGRRLHDAACGLDLARRRRIDPRVSFLALAILNVQLGLSAPVWTEFAVFALCAVCVLYCGRFRALAGWTAAYAAFLAAGFGLAAFGGPAASAFAAMFLMYRRVVPLGMFAMNMMATTRTGELACAFQALRFSSRFTVALCVAFRFFPTMGREFAAVKDAMRTRGLALTPASIVRHPAKTMERLLVPVMGRLGIVSDELGNAVLVRGADTDGRRTSLYRLAVGPVDAAVLVAAAAVLAVPIAAKAGGAV